MMASMESGSRGRRRVSRVAPIADEPRDEDERHEVAEAVRVDEGDDVSQDTASLNSNETHTLLTPVNSENIGLLRPVSNLDEDESSDDEEDDSNNLDESNLSEDASIDLISTQDLKTSLLEAVQSNQQLKEQLGAVKALLAKEAAQVAKLRSELLEARRQHNSESNLSEARIKSLARENELLKHQLKKYVGAVQRLKESSSSDDKIEQASEQDVENRGPKYVDYHFEASEYEKKLIQVSEMHGELLEFNEHLQHLVQLKDTMMVRMREELIQLRGPLPIDFSQDLSDDTDTVSTVSSIPTNSSLLHTWIPSVFLGGSMTTRNKNKHHVYQVYLRIGDEEWNIYRRYSHFYALHQQLCRQDSRVSSFDFPPKKTLGRRSEKLVEDRRRRLQSYLRQVVNLMVQTNPSLSVKPDKESVLLLMPFFGENYLSSTKDSVHSNNAFKRSPSVNPSDINNQLAF